MEERLYSCSRHKRLLLLCHSFAIPKVLHILRSSPSILCLTYHEDYDYLRRMLSDIINVHLECPM